MSACPDCAAHLAARTQAEATARTMREALNLAAAFPTPYAGMWHAPGHDDPSRGACVGCVIESALATLTPGAT